MREAPTSLDPADSRQADSPSVQSISRLLFATLVILDGSGRPLPALASSWQASPGNQRWQFNLRRGATFQDGTAVTADIAAASLRTANPDWKIAGKGEAVIIQSDVPMTNLPAILALPRYGIARRAGGKLTGSGPFAITAWEPGRKLSLAARDDYWGGRAYLDAIEFEMGKSFREQTMLFDLGKVDLTELAPDQANPVAQQGHRIEGQVSTECMALVFTRERETVEDGKLRQALGMSIDREAINKVLLQGGGEPSGALLPGWMTGYAFLFSNPVDLAGARQLRGDLRQVWTLGYDGADPLARVMAERIALNARDAGLTLQPVSSMTGDVRLMRIPLASADAWVALADLAARVGLPRPSANLSDADSGDALYSAERALLQSQRVIPLLYLRSASALSARVIGWAESRNGDWQLENVWMSREKP